MKSIYFVQASNIFGSNAHLPYAAGCVAAYAWDHPLISENYRLEPFAFLRRPIEQALASFENPYMVAFSNYVWNFEYHKALAKAVKERWPDCLVVFGGHQVLNDSSEQLERYSFVDFLIHKAGEIPFRQLLLALLQGETLSGVPSLSYRGADGGIIRTQDIPCESCDFPSPYLAGVFDDLFREYPEFLFSMTLETNRGCPYSCAYCDWGAVRHSLHCAPMERVKAEIDWAARHKIEFVLCADANFGILERDEEIVDYLIESKRRTGYPGKVRVFLLKESNETVFRLNEKLNAHGLSNGVALSFQSLSPEALKSIGRENLGFEHFRELIPLYLKVGVPMYTELILGLPGETLDSFARGIGTLLAAGIHGALEIFRCELLPNAEMSSPSYREKHGVKAVRVRQYQRHESLTNQDEFPEYSEYVYQTNTMRVQDWITANMFSDFVQGFHCLGLLPCVAAFLHWEQALPYERFYNDLMDFAGTHPSTLIGELLSFCGGRYEELSQGKGESIVWHNPRFGDIAWPLGSALFLRSVFEAERFYRELPSFLRQYGMDSGLQSELLRYQRAMVCSPEPSPQQCFTYDFPAYFAAVFSGSPPSLKKKRSTVLFPEQQSMNWEDFSREYVWYGRRKGALAGKDCEVNYG